MAVRNIVVRKGHVKGIQSRCIDTPGFIPRAHRIGYPSSAGRAFPGPKNGAGDLLMPRIFRGKKTEPAGLRYRGLAGVYRWRLKQGVLPHLHGEAEKGLP